MLMIQSSNVCLKTSSFSTTCSHLIPQVYSSRCIHRGANRLQLKRGQLAELVNDLQQQGRYAPTFGSTRIVTNAGVHVGYHRPLPHIRRWVTPLKKLRSEIWARRYHGQEFDNRTRSNKSSSRSRPTMFPHWASSSFRCHRDSGTQPWSRGRDNYHHCWLLRRLPVLLHQARSSSQLALPFA